MSKILGHGISDTVLRLSRCSDYHHTVAHRSTERKDYQGVSIFKMRHRGYSCTTEAMTWVSQTFGTGTRGLPNGNILRSLMSRSNEIINTIVGIVRPGEWPKVQPILTTRRIGRQQKLNAIPADYQCNRWHQHLEQWAPIKRLSSNVTLLAQAPLWAIIRTHLSSPRESSSTATSPPINWPTLTTFPCQPTNHTMWRLSTAVPVGVLDEQRQH